MSWGARWTEEQLSGYLGKKVTNVVDHGDKVEYVEHVPRETRATVDDVAEAVTRAHRDIEHQLQCALFEHAELHRKTYPELEWLHAVPNGGFRNPRTAGRMKAEGVKTGIPDVCLPVARGGYHGLYIEMKTPEGLTTPLQNRCIRFLRRQGYCVQIFDDWVPAWRFIVDYIEEKLT